MPSTLDLSAQAARSALAAGALLLCEPDETVMLQLQAAGHAGGLTLADLRQQFYDRFCIPQSGLYVPPFEHVFRLRSRVENRWHFPPARFDGARDVEALYGLFGFSHTRLDVNPLLRGPHLPGDHLGFMLVFAGWALENGEQYLTREPEAAMQLAGFVDQHLDRWVEAYGELLEDSEPEGYPAAVGHAVVEAVADVRQAAARLVLPQPLAASLNRNRREGRLPTSSSAREESS